MTFVHYSGSALPCLRRAEFLSCGAIFLLSCTNSARSTVGSEVLRAASAAPLVWDDDGKALAVEGDATPGDCRSCGICPGSVAVGAAAWSGSVGASTSPNSRATIFFTSVPDG